MYFNCFYCPMQCFYRQYSQGGTSPQPPSSDTNSRPPAGPPPPFTPAEIQVIYQPHSTSPNAYLFFDSSVIKTYMFRYVYIWLKDGTGFWAWINYVDNVSVAGWRWNGSNWVPFKLEIRTIDLLAAF